MAFLKLALACAFTVLFLAKARGGDFVSFGPKWLKSDEIFALNIFKATVACITAFIENMKNLGLLTVHKNVSKYAENFLTYLKNILTESKCTWRRRKETFGVFSLYAKRYKTEHKSVNNGHKRIF